MTSLVIESIRSGFAESVHHVSVAVVATRGVLVEPLQRNTRGVVTGSSRAAGRLRFS